MQNNNQIEYQSGNSYNHVLPLVVGGLTITCEDNMELMARYPDNYFDLAIVDPPYGLGNRLTSGGSSSSFIVSEAKNVKDWDVKPTKEYFTELKRVSKNQIVWGGNYFADNLGEFRCFIYWDKTIHGNSYSDGELAWTSFDKPSRYFRQNIATITSEGRIHPTQKSIKLYKWILDKFAKPNDKILDTHLGSGSIAIACHDYGFELTACELDKEYFEKTKERIINHVAQQKLF